MISACSSVQVQSVFEERTFITDLVCNFSWNILKCTIFWNSFQDFKVLKVLRAAHGKLYRKANYWGWYGNTERRRKMQMATNSLQANSCLRKHQLIFFPIEMIFMLNFKQSWNLEAVRHTTFNSVDQVEVIPVTQCCFWSSSVWNCQVRQIMRNISGI